MIYSTMILLGAAAMVATIFWSVRLPPIVAFIATGVLVGPSGLGLVGNTHIDTLMEIIAVLLMFTIGLQFSFQDVMSTRRSLLWVGAGQVLLTFFIFTALFALILPISWGKAAFFGFLGTTSSTAIVLKLLYDNRETETPYGRTVFGILLVQNIAIVPMIVAIPFLARTWGASTTFIESLIPVVLLMGLALLLIYALHRSLLPFVFERISRARKREVFLFTLLFIVLGMATVMHTAGLSVSLGAFVAGMILAGSAHGKKATAEILPLRDTFLGIFFVTLGMLVDLSFLFNNLHKVLALGVLVVAIKCLILFAIAWLASGSTSVARATAALLFQCGEFSFLLAEQGLRLNLMSAEERQYVLSIALITSMITPLVFARFPQVLKTTWFNDKIPYPWQQRLVAWREKLQAKLDPAVPGSERELQAPRDHVLIIGFGLAGQSLAKVLKHLNVPLHVVEIKADSARAAHKEYPITLGDATHPEVLKRAGVLDAKLIVCVVSGVNMLEPVLGAVMRLRPDAPVLARTNFLHDLKRLPQTRNVQYVVSEFQSALEVIDQALSKFAVHPTQAGTILGEFKELMRSQGIVSNS